MATLKVEVRLKFVKLGDPMLKLVVTEAVLSGGAKVVPVEPFTVDAGGVKRKVFFVRIVAEQKDGKVVVRDEPVVA